MASGLARISSAGAPGRRRQPYSRKGARKVPRRLNMPAEIDKLIADEAEAEGRTYGSVVADGMRQRYGLGERQPDAE